MARDFGIILSRVWREPKFEKESFEVVSFFNYLCSTGTGNQIGLFENGMANIRYETSLTDGAIEMYAERLIRAETIKREDDWWWIISMVKVNNVLTGKTKVVGAKNILKKVPEIQLKRDFLMEYPELNPKKDTL